MAPSQRPAIRTGRWLTGGIGGNNLCPAASKSASERDAGNCGKEPAAAGGSGPESYCPGSPARRRDENQHELGG